MLNKFIKLEWEPLVKKSSIFFNFSIFFSNIFKLLIRILLDKQIKIFIIEVDKWKINS